MTWNFRHINNDAKKQTIGKIVNRCGYECPIICSPESFEVISMIEDPIVEEIRRYRKAHAAQYGNDLKRSWKRTRVRTQVGPRIP